MNRDKLEDLRVKAELLKNTANELIADINSMLDETAESVGLDSFVTSVLGNPTLEDLKIFRALDAVGRTEVEDEPHEEERIVENELEKSVDGRAYVRYLKDKRDKAGEALDGSRGGSFRRSY